MWRGLLIFLFLSNIVGARDVRIEEFDPKRKTVADVLKIVRSEVGKGATAVIFPQGEWRWHSPLVAENPKKEAEFSKKTFRASNMLTAEITRWLQEAKPVSVQFALDPKLPAESYFAVEKVLRKHKLRYWTVSGTTIEDGMVTLLETDGRARVVTPEQ